MLQIQGKASDLGGGLVIHRILPNRAKRMVGPFTFLDHMGPLTASADQNTDVRPHPHIGLSTLTYLYAGRMLHKDSIGSVAEITPGEVNWMTSGKGISHSERTPDNEKGKERPLHGLQFWIALPDDLEDCEPSFQHYKKSQIPKVEHVQYSISVIVGEAFGKTSPVKTTSPMIFTDIKAKDDCEIKLKIKDFELAAYVLEGSLTFEENQVPKLEMIIADVNQELVLQVKKGTHFVIIGGIPFTTPRFMWWNLVSSSKEKIENAKRLWETRQFPQVPGETEFIPLPKS